jgi:putative acetyltransferase
LKINSYFLLHGVVLQNRVVGRPNPALPVPMPIDIAIEPPDQPETVALLAELDSYLTKLYPPESTYLLDVASLRAPDIRFFVARNDGAAVGCGALRVEEDGYGEIKRMFVAPAARGLGIAKRLLVAIEAEGRRLGLRTLRLETGIYQTDALGLYAAVGYREIRPFGEYAADGPHSRFLAKPLAPAD